jgi:hypothetical protein
MSELKAIEDADGIRIEYDSGVVFECAPLRVDKWMQRGKFKGYSLVHVPTGGIVAIFDKRKAMVIECARELAGLSWAAFNGQRIKYADMDPEQRECAIAIWQILIKHAKAMKPGYQVAVRETLNKALDGTLTKVEY